MAFRLYPFKHPRPRADTPSEPKRLKRGHQLPLPLDMPTAAEYRARIAKAALSGFQDGDDLVSIGLGVKKGAP